MCYKLLHTNFSSPKRAKDELHLRCALVNVFYYLTDLIVKDQPRLTRHRRKDTATKNP